MDLHIRAVLGSQSHCAVQHKFHVSGSGRFLGSQGDLLRDIRRRNHFRCLGYIVVLQHDHLEIRAYLRIGSDQFLQAEDQVDDILGDRICRSCLCAEDHGNRSFRLVSCLDVHVFVDRIQGIHLLAFVLVKTFYLYVEDRILIHCQVLGLVEILLQCLFIVFLDLFQLFQHFRVIFVFQKLFQFHRVLLISASDQALNVIRQLVIAVDQPAAERNTVGLIVELLRIDIIERFQLGVFQDLCVQRRHTIDRETVMDIHMCHMHTSVLVDDGNFFPFIFGFRPGIQLKDDRKQMRNHLFQIIDRPFFQRFGKDRMVSVRTGLADYMDCLIQSKSSLLKQTDQFRDYHGRMGIVDLDHHMLIQVMQVIAFLIALLQDQLCAVADHEILLVDTQKLSGAVTVVRIQEQGQVFLDLVLVKTDTVARHDPLIHRIYIKQMQTVASGIITRYINVIQHRVHGKILKRHLEGYRLLHQPALCGKPWILHLFLLVVHKHLAEQSEMVVQADTVARKSQGRNGIQKTCRQTSQSAVAQRRFQLHFLNLCQISSVFFQRVRHFIVHAEIDQVVGQQLSDQELCGNVIQFFLSFISPAGSHLLLGQYHQHFKDLALCAVVNISSKTFF